MTFIIEKDGHKRQAKKVKCLTCKKNFLKATRFIKPNIKNYCSIKCANIGQHNRVILSCDTCNKTFKRVISKTKYSKSGLYFCSRICKDIAQKLGGRKEIQPPHYGQSLRVYRSIAFQTYDSKCAVCDYDNHIEILEVHHIDGNRENNDALNLIILCPNHHAALTRGYAVLEDKKLMWK